MGELWERSQKAPYEKVGNYKYLQVFIQVPLQYTGETRIECKGEWGGEHLI